MRDLPTCADLRADYCPVEKTPSAELFERPEDLAEEPDSPPVPEEAEPQSPAGPVQEAENAPLWTVRIPQPEAPNPVERSSVPEPSEPLGEGNVHLVTPTSDAGWNAASALRSKQSTNTARPSSNSTGIRNNGCWQYS